MLVCGSKPALDQLCLCVTQMLSYILKQTWCLSVCSSQTFADCGQGSRCEGPGGATAFYTSSVDAGCVMQFGAKQCAQQARRGCTGHDGRAKPAWAACTGPARVPHSVRRSPVPTSAY
jgi:hypothetical protein